MCEEHVLVSTQIRCETGPTVVGDADSDPELMAQLHAQKLYRLGNTFPEYISDWPPRRVLDKLGQLGFSICGMTGAGQTVIWTLRRRLSKDGGGKGGGQTQNNNNHNKNENNGTMHNQQS